MLSWVEPEKSFKTLGPDLELNSFQNEIYMGLGIVYWNV